MSYAREIAPCSPLLGKDYAEELRAETLTALRLQSQAVSGHPIEPAYSLPKKRKSLPLSQDWRSRSACASTHSDLFFSERPEDITAAKAVCATCPVREPCLENARANREEYGVWGGINFAERGFTNRIKHGTYTGYVRGCRLYCCAEAKRKYARSQRAEAS